MKLHQLYLFLATIISLLFFACEKEVIDDGPDFIFQGTLTGITDGTPKEEWTVNFRQFISPLGRPDGWLSPPSFGFETLDENGQFSMDVNTFTDFREQGRIFAADTPEAKKDFYAQYVLSFRAPGESHGLIFDVPDHLFLDPDDVDLKLEAFDFSRKGEVINRDVKIFTGDRGSVTYRYLLEEPTQVGQSYIVRTSLRDLAFARPFLSVPPNAYGQTRVGEQYERKLKLPVGRPVEAVTSFRTVAFTNRNTIVTIDSLIFRDTFLLQSSVDTLQLRNYRY